MSPSSVVNCPSPETLSNGGNNFARRGEHAQRSKRAPVDHRLAVDEHSELAVMTFDHIDVGTELTT